MEKLTHDKYRGLLLPLSSLLERERSSLLRFPPFQIEVERKLENMACKVWVNFHLLYHRHWKYKVSVPLSPHPSQHLDFSVLRMYSQITLLYYSFLLHVLELLITIWFIFIFLLVLIICICIHTYYIYIYIYIYISITHNIYIYTIYAYTYLLPMTWAGSL
jgi:hypothetical protein